MAELGPACLSVFDIWAHTWFYFRFIHDYDELSSDQLIISSLVYSYNLLEVLEITYLCQAQLGWAEIFFIVAESSHPPTLKVLDLITIMSQPDYHD